jgi:hypothetical protein
MVLNSIQILQKVILGLECTKGHIITRGNICNNLQPNFEYMKNEKMKEMG